MKIRSEYSPYGHPDHRPLEDHFSYYWEDSSGVVMSPRFPKEELAMTWYKMHEQWIEDPLEDPLEDS